MHILIFSTSIDSNTDMEKISPVMNTIAGIEQWTVDTGDCDKILRVVAATDISPGIVSVLESQGYTCQRIAGVMIEE